MKNAFHRFVGEPDTVVEITSEFEDVSLLSSKIEIQRIKKEHHKTRMV